MVGAPMSALLHSVRAKEGPSAPLTDELPSWIPRIEVHKHCSQRLGHGVAASHQAKLATHPCVDRLPSEIALFASAPPARLHFQVTRLAAGGLDGPSPDLGSIVSALKQLAPGGNNRASARANASPLLRVTSSLDIKQYGEAPALVAALASSVGARGPADDGSASSTSFRATEAQEGPSAPALRTGLLARSMARTFRSGAARLSEQAAEAETAEGGVVLPVLLVDEELVPSLEGGKDADWGVAHMGEGAAEEDGRPAVVVVAVVRRRGDVEVIDVDATAKAAGSVLRLIGALPPPGSVIAEGRGQWAARSWGEAVTSVGESAAVALAWPSVLVRGLAAARLQAASAMLSAARIDESNAHLLDTRLWSGLVSRWAGTARLQARAAELGREALGLASGGADGRRRAATAAGTGGAEPAPGVRARFLAAAAHLLAEADAAFEAAAALAVAADHAHGGCGTWVEDSPAGVGTIVAWGSAVAGSPLSLLGGALLSLALGTGARMALLASQRHARVVSMRGRKGI
ncbi:hypothetical protein FNF27_00708 [Cafeteria roenbergensis]|uniref:Uncharacterized protein n=1 Tax=Cafeteria roenbergensis TaxID=33653 RepID=A0A5A8EK32_CAFRO|nr:hypothetical protein FNF29_07557 [Cafeteria roenbergensis]KAA0177538.1 hypothetical protein FNF27_00708 [Cafeteria roenbergensis]|eukprot:KAA0147185.1 hypothetical protein FNF29_07557 [Cafeteria roenbergensis]